MKWVKFAETYTFKATHIGCLTLLMMSKRVSRTSCRVRKHRSKFLYTNTFNTRGKVTSPIFVYVKNNKNNFTKIHR